MDSKPSSGESTRLRGVDLARAAGISVQQVRNYVDVGLLPPTERTASGYRVFTAAHARAMPVARQVLAAFGWEDAATLMTAAHAGDVDRVVELIDHAHAQLDRDRGRIQAALRAFEQVVINPLDADPRMSAALRLMQRQQRPLQIGQLAELLGIRTSALRFWQRSGLLSPTRDRAGYRVYDQIAVRDAHLIHLLRTGGFPTSIIRAALDEMHSSPTGRANRVGTELSRRNRELYRRSRRRMRATAALSDYIDTLAGWSGG